MIRVLCIAFLFSCFSFVLGQQALTDNVNGRWCIYWKGERKLLDPTIHELGNFDQQGLSFFMRRQKYGLINSEGQTVLEETYKSIQQLGGGYYLLLDDKKQQILVNWNSGSLKFRDVAKLEKLDPNWCISIFDSTKLLINVNASKEWELSYSDEVLQNDFKHFYCTVKGERRLFSPDGEEIDVTESKPIFARDYLLVQSSGKNRIIYRHHEIQLPADAKRIRVRENEVLYSQGGKSTILSSKDGSLIATFPYENVSYYNDNLLTVRKNGNAGLAKMTGEMVVPVKYSSVSVVRGLYFVRNSKGLGVLGENGQQLIPCKYNSIIPYKAFFQVNNDLEMSGLISRKTGKTLLPCDYSQLKINDSVVRGISRDMLRILKLDTNHHVVSDIVMANVTSLVRTSASEELNVDKRLYPLGWFHTTVPQFDSLGFQVGEETRWGLKGPNDTLLSAPKYKEPIYVEQADFSLLVTGIKKIKVSGIGKRDLPLFRAMSYLTGKLLVPEGIISLDTTDLLSRSYSRFISEKGKGILLNDNTILRVSYFDENDTRYLRYCSSKAAGMLPADKENHDALRYYNLDLNDDDSKWLQVEINKKIWNYMRFEQAEWNYLDTNGKAVFSEPFDFGYPYSSETAIVQKSGKWGVVRADSTVIPAIYSKIDRSPISDTLFVVKRSVKGVRFLDTNGRVMMNGITRFYSDKGPYAQIAVRGEKRLVLPDYDVISGDTRFQKILENGAFYSKRKKEYTIYDCYGSSLGAVQLKPEAVWFDEMVLAKGRGKYGVLSTYNDTLIPFKYKKIMQLGTYIFAQNGSENLLFDQDLKVIRKLKTKDLLVDSISDFYAAVSYGKVTTYDKSNKKLGKFSGTNFEHFHDGYLIEFGKTLRVVHPDKVLSFDFQPKEFIVMEDNGYLIIDSKKIGHYFNREWEEITFDEPLTKVTYVGEGLAFSRSKSVTRLFGGDTDVELKVGYRSTGSFKNGFLLVEYEGKFEFLNVEGVNEFTRAFEFAEPFSGPYATVKESEGWTIIDGNGHFQILPGFDKITPLSPSIFSTKTQPVYGLFDSHGNELIPAEFQQLNFLLNDIIQGRKNGEIFYFDRNGNPIELH